MTTPSTIQIYYDMSFKILYSYLDSLTGNFILLHEAAKNPCPSDDPNTDSCACIFYGIIIFWAPQYGHNLGDLRL